MSEPPSVNTEAVFLTFAGAFAGVAALFGAAFALLGHTGWGIRLLVYAVLIFAGILWVKRAPNTATRTEGDT